MWYISTDVCETQETGLKTCLGRIWSFKKQAMKKIKPIFVAFDIMRDKHIAKYMPEVEW